MTESGRRYSVPHQNPSDHWRRVKELFADVVARDPDERSATLAAACADDAGLRREVEELLAAYDAAGDLLEEPPHLALALAESAMTAAPEIPHLVVGRQLGPYRVLESIGSGGMGEVYRARDARLHRDVALKVLPPDLVGDPARRARFVQEARTASALEHPHIAAVHEIADIDGVTCLVMELVRGEPLAAIIARGPLRPSRAIEIAIEIAEALGRAHAIGIIHRDLKPANIMVTPAGHVKIIDFGLAKLIGGSESRLTAVAGGDGLTASGTVVGTAAYMSPEQAQGAPLDHRSDIFSFGIVLQEMLTGSSPFRRRSGVDTRHAILNDAPPRLADSGVDTTGDIQRVLDRCLAKPARDRYESMDRLAADLSHARRRLESSELRALEGPPAFDRWMRIAAAATIAVTAAIATGIWLAARREQNAAERSAAIARVKEYVDNGRFVDVWRIAGSALQRWPGDPALEQMLHSTTQRVTLVTEPAGADVAFKAYEDAAGEWLPIGKSPLRSVMVPLGMLRWRVTKAGFDPLEARLELGTPAAAAGRPDVEAKPIHLRPGGSPMGRMVFVSGGDFDGVTLTDFWIDQYEVTNREFKAFVDRGAYDPRFRDESGRPGPAVWHAGTYPAGQDDDPVSGVSWYEAVAYCRFVGKELPTLYHWKRAAGAAFFSEVITAGNFGGRGPQPVTQLKDVGPFGTYGMSGNVKEWVWNEIEGQRYILGGAWNEPVYMAIADDRRPPEDRAATNGLRCIKEAAPSSSAAYATQRPAPARDILNQKPVDDRTFEIYRGFYSYNQTPLTPRLEAVQDSPSWRRERVSFAAAYGGERVIVNILLPKNTPPPYQAVIWFPGSYALALRHSDGDLPFSYYFDFLPVNGRALVYPVYKGTYERRAPVDEVSDLRDVVVQWSKDLGRTIDYLSSRGDMAPGQIAYYGFSMGAADALPALAVEKRIKAAILLAGGIDASSDTLPEIDAVNFAPRIKMPVLMLSGEYDFAYPPATSQAPLFKLLGTARADKQYVLFHGSGHIPPRGSVIRAVLDWLDRYLPRTSAGAS